jgi:GT2 family glycosyltransferase
MDNSVVLAIGIPTINRADLLDEALQVYKDTFYGRHQLIIDNGNQPIQTYSGDQKVLKMPQNLGVSGSWNLIMKTLKNKGYTHVAILNDDIVWKKTADQVEEFIQSNPADFYQGTGTWCCFVLPVKTFDEVGGFDEGFARSYFEDNDMNIRMLRKNKKILVNPIFNPEVYRNSQTILKDPSLNTHFDKNRQRYIDKWGGLPTQEKYELPWNGGEGYDIPWK